MTYKPTERQKKIKKVDDVFSLFIRHRDSKDGYGYCCTCGMIITIKKAQCGHFMSRRHLSTRWDEKNCGYQCFDCNIKNQGKQYQFGIYIDKRWGKGTAEMLMIKSKNISKIGNFELDYLYKEYSKKLKEVS